ncbi:MAG: AAA family ATPase, partial [bacterium]
MPYPGLRPFAAEDAPLFFGREAQISALLRQLEDHRFVAVVGSSGSGKSSLVRAGLLPAVREGFLLGTTDWRVLLMRPGQYPYQGLARALDEATRPHGEAPIAPGEEASGAPREAKALAALRSADRGLLLALTDTEIGAHGKVMVVVDQFEELFAFRRTGARREDVISRDEAAGFVRLILRSCSDPEGRVWVVLTMRSDFIGDCEAFLGLPEAVSRSQFLVPRLDRSQMEEAIMRPGKVRDADFQPFSFEEG